VKVTDNDGQQPLHWATQYGKLEALILLLADPRIDLYAKTSEPDPQLEENYNLEDMCMIF
jgi:ankyrin repeat protein